MAASRATGIIPMMFDDDDFSALLQQRHDEPLAEDQDRMHEAIEQYLRKRRSNFIEKDGPRRQAESRSTVR